MLRVAHDQRRLWAGSDHELQTDDAGRDCDKGNRAVRIVAGRDLALPLAEIEDRGGTGTPDYDFPERVIRVARGELAGIDSGSRHGEQLAIGSELLEETLRLRRYIRVSFRAAVEQQLEKFPVEAARGAPSPDRRS